MYVDFEAPWMNLDSSSSTTASLLQELRYHTLDALPDKFYRIPDLGKKEHQIDVQIIDCLSNDPGIVGRYSKRCS